MCSNGRMAIDITTDIRLDPRVRQVLELIPSMSLGDVTSREELLAESNSPAGSRGQQLFRAVHDASTTPHRPKGSR